MADRRQMQAQLMRASRDRFQHHARLCIMRGKQAIAGEGGFARDGINLAPGTVWPVDANWQIDFAHPLGQPSCDHGLITFEYLTLLKQVRQLALYRGTACEQEQAGSGHVQPVNDQRVRKYMAHPRPQAILFVSTSSRHSQ